MANRSKLVRICMTAAVAALLSAAPTDADVRLQHGAERAKVDAVRYPSGRSAPADPRRSPARRSADPGADVLRFRITGEGTLESEIDCDESGRRCPPDEAREQWTVTVAHSVFTAEAELERLSWGSADNDQFELCYVAGRHQGRFAVRTLEWWTRDEAFAHGTEEFAPEAWSDADRVLVVRIAPGTPPARGAQTSGDCPAEIRNSDGERPYDAMSEDLEETVFDASFHPPEPGTATTVSRESDEIIRQWRLEVLEGDLHDLERYATLRSLIEPLVRPRQ